MVDGRGEAPGGPGGTAPDSVIGHLSEYSAFHTLYKSKKSRVWLCKDRTGTQVVMKAYSTAALCAGERLKARRRKIGGHN